MDLKRLITWSRQEFQSLPWRQNRSLYKTLVSEIMLQQTTVGTVKNHFERFLKIFPTLESLSAATEEELLVAWKGLGYYRRARNLKKIAESLDRDHGGKFPNDLEALMRIPGIGPYTSGALVSIGMDERAIAVDANLERVISRLFAIEVEKGPKLQKEILRLFSERKIFDQKISFRALNEALMDLGRTYCQANKASCELCPLKQDCVSYKKNLALSFPQVSSGMKKRSQEHQLELLRIFIQKGNRLLVYKKSDKEWLAGQYEVPTMIISSTDKSLAQYVAVKRCPKTTESFSTSITKYKIKNSIFLGEESDLKKFGFNRDYEWRKIDDEKANFSTATIKGLKLIRK